MNNGYSGPSPFDSSYFTLGAPVGPEQPNRREDVIKVETLLGNTGHLDLTKTDGPLGLWSERPEQCPRLVAIIKHNQLVNKKWDPYSVTYSVTIFGESVLPICRRAEPRRH